MKIFKNWFVISLIASVVLMLLSLLFWGNWYLSVFIGVIVFIWVIKLNPKLRYIRAFGTMASMFLLLNGCFFKFATKIGDSEFIIGNHPIGESVSVAFIIVMALLLILDYLERSGKLKFDGIDSIKFSFSKINNKGDNNNNTIINN